jgi:hypothetical protein
MPNHVQFFRPAMAAMAVAGFLAITGCGSSGGGGGKSTDPLSDMSAKQVAAKAIADLRSAPSFTIRGSGPDNGQTVSLSLGYKGGTNCEGTIGLGPDGTLTITVIGGTAWVKPNATFWKTEGGSDGAQAGKLLAGKYLKAPTTSHDISQLASVCNVGQLTSQMSLPADTAKGSFTTVGGQRVLTLTDKAKDSTMYVTDSATPRILKVVSKKPGDSGQFTIAYGIPATIAPPPASETLNGSQFGF